MSELGLGAANGANGFDAENTGLVASVSQVSPDTITKIVKRLRALTLALLPLEVDPDSINAPTSRIITPEVISSYHAAGGDFEVALPYCLLRARAQFMWDANHNPADYGENYGRAVACEVLARRLVHMFARDKLCEVMSTRYQHYQVDGDVSETSSALEMAVDQHCTIFLSSNEAQEVIQALWNGELVQVNNKNHDIDYVPHYETREHTLVSRIDASRLSVPRYQNIFRVMIWLFFLVVYSLAVREPLDKIDITNRVFDAWEIILYVLAFSFAIEDTLKIFKLLRFVTWWRAFSFWNIIALVTDTLLLVAFILRVLSVQISRDMSEDASYWRLYSFQILSCVAPFIWMKLVTVFDGYKYIGTMQICVARMLKESGIFFALLSVLAIGFAQALFALDAADGTIESPAVVANMLVQSLLQSPNFDKFSASPIGLLLYYFWTAVTAIVLLNVLISLFSSAYSDVVDNAEAQYLAFFATKTVGMIRAPDAYVYPAPFNLIEAIFIVPFEILPYFHLSEKNYARLNRYVMSFVFFIPLTVIALYESTSSSSSKNRWTENWFRGDDEAAADTPENRDPIVDDPNCVGLQISRVEFKELTAVFPSITQSSEHVILGEIENLKKKMDMILEKLNNS